MSHLRLDIPLWNRSTEGRTDGDLFPVNGAVLNLDGSDDRKFKDWNMSYLRIIWHCIEMGTNIFFTFSSPPSLAQRTREERSKPTMVNLLRLNTTATILPVGLLGNLSKNLFKIYWLIAKISWMHRYSSRTNEYLDGP